MTQLYYLPTKRRFLVLLLLFTLFIIFLLYISIDQTHKLPEIIVEIDKVSETTIHSEIKIENDKVSENITSSWLHYSKNWDGEILVITHPREANVTLTDNYRMEMRSKGLHPLNLQYKRLRDRMERIDKYCNISLSGNDAEYRINGLYGMLFHDESQLLQCLVPKVGSSSWVHVFGGIVGLEVKKPFDPSDVLWRTISIILNMNDIILTAQRFQTYTKFLFSRQPFQRLISAHRDKFHNKQLQYENAFAPQIIIANYLSNYSKEFISEMRKMLENGLISDSSSEIVQIARLDAGFDKFNITFLEFLKYIIFFTRKSSANDLDIHWRPISLLCKPCAIKYDVIGRFETLSEDSEAILDFVHPNIPEFMYEFPKRNPKVTSNNCNEVFRKIPLEVRRSLYDIYRDDFLLFDYEYNEDESADLC